jgi:hypothetical protein
VWLMANIDRDNGAVKGVLATVTACHKHVINVRLQNPTSPETAELTLCRFNYNVEVDYMPVQILRKQFPTMLAWAATVHRVQGGTLKRVLVDLRGEFFAHGQLNTAASRGHTRHDTRYLVPSKDLYETEFECTNVVVPQMLFKGPYEN